MNEIQANIATETDINNYKVLSTAVISGDIPSAVAETRRLIETGSTIQYLLDRGLIATMDRVGENFSKGVIFIPQMLRSAKTMQECIKIMEPFFKESDVQAKGRVLIGTVKGDLHDIGKNLVCMMLQGAGFEIVDLGVDVSADKFVGKAKELKPDILAMSALLSTTMPAMSLTLAALEKEGLRDRVKVMVGGAPVTQKYADEIKADLYAEDAGAAVAKAKAILSLY